MRYSFSDYALFLALLYQGRDITDVSHDMAQPHTDLISEIVEHWTPEPFTGHDGGRSCLREQEDAMALDPLSAILNAGLELAWAEHRREPLDEAELDALDLCDEIGAVRNIVAFEVLHGRTEAQQGLEIQE